MKSRMWIGCLLLIAWCGIIHAELDTLEKLRTTGWDFQPALKTDAAIALMFMEDAAAPFLIQTLAGASLVARSHAIDFLRDLFPDARALPALTEIFLQDANPGMRSAAAQAIASIDSEIARDLVVQHLGAPGANETTQDIAADILIQLEDKRVIPTLVRRLSVREKRMGTAFALATFKDKRAVPVLLDILDERYGHDKLIKVDAAEALAKIGDARAEPVLMNLLDSPQIGAEVADALPQFGISIVPPLLEKLKQTQSREIQERLARILRHFHQPELAPIFGQLYLESDEEDSELQDAMAHALKNMGIGGFKQLVKVANQNPNYRALSALASYNSGAAVDTVAALALDKAYPLRLEAIQTLGSLGKLWEAEISTYLLQLLSDAAPEVKLYTMDIIQQGKLVEMAPALQELTQTDNEHLQRAAHYVLAVLADEMPLRLEVKMSRPRYAYGINTDIVVFYRIMNLGTFPIQIALTPRIKEFEIQQPDGTLARRSGSLSWFLGLYKEAFETLPPGGNLTMNFVVSKSHWLDQVGRYTIRPRIHTWDPGLRFGFIAWTGTLTAPDVHFEIEPPTAEQVTAMLTQVEADLGTTVFRNQGIRTLCQLAELRIPGALPVLKNLALTESLAENDHIQRLVLAVLGKFASPELNPLWMQMLENGDLPSGRAIEALIQSKDKQAIALIRRIIYQRFLNSPNRKEIFTLALTLQRFLGDNSVSEWLKATAERKIRHWASYKREEGARILHSLWNPNYHPRNPPNVFINPRFYLQNADSASVSEWEEIRDKSITIVGLEALLGHTNRAIQQAAAYELAHRGNTSGVYLIEPDLHANDAETRVRAREALVRARTH